MQRCKRYLNKERGSYSCAKGGSTEKLSSLRHRGLKKAGFSWCLGTLKATRFSKFAQKKADLMELSHRVRLTVQFISRITTKLCDL